MSDANFFMVFLNSGANTFIFTSACKYDDYEYHYEIIGLISCT